MSEDKIWYIALNDEQVGPLSEDEVRAEIDAGQVTGSTYIWRDGLEDWVMAEDAAEFAGIVPAETAVFDEFEDAQEPDIADVAGESVDAFFASYDTPTTSEDEASVAAAGGASDDGGPSGIVSSTVASRSDDSVLFSLDELAQTTERASQADDSTTDGSGLIDLSALASTSATLGASGAAQPLGSRDDAPAAATSSPTRTVAPIALAPPKKSALPMVLLAVAVVAILGLLVAIYLLLGSKDDSAPVAEGAQQEAVAQADADSEDAAKAEEADDEAGEQAAADDKGDEAAEGDGDEPEEPEAPEAPEAVAAAKKPAAPSTPRAARKEPAAASKPAPAAKPAPSRSAPTRSAPAKPKPADGDSVSAALASISGDDKKAPSSSGSSAPTELSNSQIRSTVRRYNSRVQGCKKSDADAGTYRIAFAISPNGRTSQVTSRDGGAAGACVADVVKTMRFPEFNGDTRKLTYTFAIR